MASAVILSAVRTAVATARKRSLVRSRPEVLSGMEDVIVAVGLKAGAVLIEV